MMRPYRKKPITIEAMQVTKEVLAEPAKHLSDIDQPKNSIVWSEHADCLLVRHNNGVLHAYVGDWLIRSLDGELYVCPADKFERTYEAV